MSEQKTNKQLQTDQGQHTFLTSKKGKELRVVPKNDTVQGCFCRQRRGHCSSLPKPVAPIKAPRPVPRWGVVTTTATPKTNKQRTWQNNNTQSVNLKQVIEEEKAKKKQQQVKKQEPTRNLPNPQLINKNDFLFINNLMKVFQLHFPLPPQSPYTLEEADPDSHDYKIILNAFAKTMLNYKTTSVKKVVNPFLLLHYNLKKTTNPSAREMLLYHGTKVENLDSICLDNFDWRLTARYKYGWGVAFSSSPYYASHYADQSGSQKVMLAAKVLVGFDCRGDEQMKIPEQPFDTTTDLKKKVYVKYDDCSFYPDYVIYYYSNKYL